MEENNQNFKAKINFKMPDAPENKIKSSDDKIVNFIVGSICFLLGFPQILFALSIAILVVPQLMSLYLSLEIKIPSVVYLAYPAAIVFVIMGAINIYHGIKTIKQASYIKRAIIFLVSSFVLQSLLVGVLTLSIIVPAYGLVGELQGPVSACTDDAKMCPDGSSVVRTGPNCEFTACPSAMPQDKPLETTTINCSVSNPQPNQCPEDYICEAKGTTQSIPPNVFGECVMHVTIQ